MFNPWSFKCAVTVGPIDEQNELRVKPADLLRYLDKIRSMKNNRMIERFGNMLIHDTRFNYFDGKQHIGLACGEYTDRSVLQNFKRFILQPDVGFMVDEHGNNSGQATATNNMATGGIHSDMYRRQIPRESLIRMLDMPIFNGTNVKCVVQSGKSLLYYLLTYLLANCMRMYVLPGPQLPSFSAILPLHAFCTIFHFNINALPRGYLVPIERTRYRYLRDSLNVKYMFRFPVNLSFLDRRDPVIHDGGIDTCDKLFLTDDEFSDFRVNCTLNCKNRNEDYDGDTNNPGFCKGIESHTEIKFNMRTHNMPLLRARHIFSQNILYRLFVLLAVDPPYERSFALIERRPHVPIEIDLYDQVLRLLHEIDITGCNPSAVRRAMNFFGPEYYVFYELYMRENLLYVRSVLRDFQRNVLIPHGVVGDTTRPNKSSFFAEFASPYRDDRDEHDDDVSALSALLPEYQNVLHKLASIWRPSIRSTTSNCVSVMDNVIRSMAIVLGDSETTMFVDETLRRVHDLFPEVYTGSQPMCFTNIVNVLSMAKGNFDNILLLQRNFENKLNLVNESDVPLALTDLLMPICDRKLQQNKQYLDNFVYGSKKVPKNSKLAISTKWTLQNVIYYDGDLYIDGRVVLPDCLKIFSYENFLDVDVVCTLFDSLIYADE